MQFKKNQRSIVLLKVQIIGRPAVDGILIHTYCHIIVLSVKLVSVYLFLGGVVRLLHNNFIETFLVFFLFSNIILNTTMQQML